MKLAVFSGVYSNYAALEAVLEDIRRRGADQVWCLGDIGGFGPHPDRSIDMLRAAGIPCLRGNYDYAVGFELADCMCGYTDPRDRHFAQIAFDYTVRNTSAENKAWLRSLPEQARLEIDGRRVLLCHGSPRRVNEFLWESTCSDAFLEYLCREYEADVIVCGHTGLPWHRALPSGRHVVNVGAIGRPANDGTRAVGYAVIESDRDVGVEFPTVDYGIERIGSRMKAEGLPAEFARTLETGQWTTCLECLPQRERERERVARHGCLRQ